MKAPCILISLLLAACSGGTSEPTGEHHERFVGTWLVDQPAHALYEATLYRFNQDGSAQMLETCSFGEAEGYVTGSVTDQRSTIRCEFANTWESIGDDTLLVRAFCSDQQLRDVSLSFLSDASANTLGAQVEVDNVDGEADWAHRDPSWSWKKCPDTGCEPLWCSE